MNLDMATRNVAENKVRAPYLSEWTHKKTGGEYVVRMHVILEADLTPCVVYYKRFAEPDQTWCRPASEFFDGRFERHSKEAD